MNKKKHARIYGVTRLSAEISRDTPLDTRLKVTNEMMIQSYLIEIGYIPDGFWSDEKEIKYGISFRKFAKELTVQQIREFTQWEKDEKPEEECKHEGIIHQGHHPGQPCWCDRCGKDI